MSKIKYIQLAFKNSECKKLVSPSQKQLDTLITDGWELVGFDSETDIPQNPILDNGSAREMTAAEITASIAALEAARQAAKPDELKQAENEYFVLIDTINSQEDLSIAYNDNSAVIQQKSQNLSMSKQAYYGILLQNAIHEVEIQNGSWYDLPTQPHI